MKITPSLKASCEVIHIFANFVEPTKKITALENKGVKPISLGNYHSPHDQCEELQNNLIGLTPHIF